MPPPRASSRNKPEQHPLGQLLADMQQVREETLETQKLCIEEWKPYIHSRDFTESAKNMGAYIGLRRHDLRHFQLQLAALGLSSLGRTEGHVLANLDAVINALSALTGTPVETEKVIRTAQTFSENSQLLQLHTRNLFGTPPQHRAVRIMVTLPSEAATDYAFVKALVERGMDCARINCAHDTAATWKQMAAYVRKAARETGHACKVLMDLAGPKLRTSTLANGHNVIHLKPKRDARGMLLEPCDVILDCSGQMGCAASKDGLGRSVLARLNVDPDWFGRLSHGDRIEFNDLRGKPTALLIGASVSATEIMASCSSSAYLEEGTVLRHFPRPKHHHPVFESALGPILSTPRPILLRKGDALQLNRADIPGEPAEIDEADNSIIPAHIACAHPEVFSCLKTGQRVLIDDGHIGTVVEALNDDGALLRVTHAREQGSRLWPEKGLNFPDTDLHLPALTKKDRDDLGSVVALADIVGYSFVQTAEDMEQLLSALAENGASKIGIIAKIETRLALSNLPEIIIRGAGSHPFGVMIARGDLAVEIGYEKLAEAQEKIMCLCESAHVPVIWATQVLESLVKQNIPTRAEVTDAAMAERAECIMLNKGPFVLDAIDVLDHLVARMQSHQTKKSAQMRTLGW